MVVPTIPLDEAALRQSADVRSDLRACADQIIAALRVSPYFVLLRGMAPSEDRSLSVALSRLIASTKPTPEGLSQERLLKVSFTRVQIDPEKAKGSGSSTSYSRTNQSLALHTDSSYLARPHRLVAFQFVRTDPVGGSSTMAPIDEIMKALAPETLSVLAQPIFPFGKGPLPILFGSPARPQIRYYRNQIDSAVDAGAALSDPAQQAMDRLDRVLDELARACEFHVAAGETLYMDNARVLHGRTPFGPTSNRLMYRLRMHCGCLD